MGDEILIGTWSASRRHSPGGMADQILVFSPDHRGFLKDCNPAMENVEFFNWKLNDDGMLVIHGTTRHYLEYDDPGQAVYADVGRLQFESLRFRVERERTPKGEEMDVLTLDEGGDEWRDCLLKVQGTSNYKFGLVKR